MKLLEDAFRQSSYVNCLRTTSMLSADDGTRLNISNSTRIHPLRSLANITTTIISAYRRCCCESPIDTRGRTRRSVCIRMLLIIIRFSFARICLRRRLRRQSECVRLISIVSIIITIVIFIIIVIAIVCATHSIIYLRNVYLGADALNATLFPWDTCRHLQ